jgi:hypothetical protein
MDRALALFFSLAFLACGPTSLGGPCNQRCDCPQNNAPVKCPGEWVCNTAKTCEYQCKAACDNSGGISTCPVDHECNGSICSTRVGCR